MVPFRPWLWFGLLALTLGPLPGEVQAQRSPSSLSDDSTVSLITILPGDPVYSFAGHSALRVHDPERNLDRLYNYGTFDFGDPFFIPKFLYGHLRYYLSVAPYDRALRVYRAQGRPVIEQTLALSRQQRTALYRFLHVNARPDNRYYQYDFFFDNCSTRIRDAVEEALGDAVAFGGCPNPNKSFRGLLDEHVRERAFLDLGFDLALGLPADRPPTAREAMFLPVYLMEAFDHATVTSADTTRPLVAQTDTVQWIEGYESSGAIIDGPLVGGWGFLVLVLVWTGWQAAQARIPGGFGDAVLFASVGLVGVGVCFLWFVSTYTVTDNNLNLAWAWPTHLVAAYLLARNPSGAGLRTYLAATAGAAALLGLGWTALPQDLHAATLPITLGVGIRAGWWALLPSVHGPPVAPLSSSPSSSAPREPAP